MGTTFLLAVSRNVHDDRHWDMSMWWYSSKKVRRPVVRARGRKDPKVISLPPTHRIAMFMAFVSMGSCKLYGGDLWWYQEYFVRPVLEQMLSESFRSEHPKQPVNKHLFMVIFAAAPCERAVWIVCNTLKTKDLSNTIAKSTTYSRNGVGRFT